MTPVEEKINALTQKTINEGIEDYIPDGIKDAWKATYAVGKAAVMPEVQGWMKNFPTIAGSGLYKAIQQGLERGGGVGAVSGAGGGAAIAGGLASGGLFNRPFQAFKNSMTNNLAQGKGTAKSRILKALGASAASLFGAGARTAGAAGIGGGIGGVLGWKGGREAGAALAGAGALGGPAGLLVGPKSGAALSALGALVASDAVKKLDTSRRELTPGGGGGFFRDRN